MKLGLIGLPQSGKSTIFSAIAGAREKIRFLSQTSSSRRQGACERVDFLTKVFKPKKSTYAHIEYLLPSQALPPQEPRLKMPSSLRPGSVTP